jgi:type II secretory pathway pseudopilin PulG
MSLLTLALVPLLPAPSLVELGTVTAIQGELSAGAAESGMYALDRTRITTAQTEMRTIAAQLERYRADNGAYPVATRMSGTYGPASGDDRFSHVFTFARAFSGGPGNLEHPRPYLAMPIDSFSQRAGRDLPYAYYIDRSTNSWLLYSPGPDGDYDIDAERDFDQRFGGARDRFRARIWDTNDPAEDDGDLYLTNRPW